MQGRRRIVGMGLSGAIAALTGGLLMIALAEWAGAAEFSVSMVDFSFSPSSQNVRVGDTVRWRNTGRAPHTTRSDSGEWDSGTIQPGGTFTHTFPRAGTFTYVCRIHAQMRGTIIVAATSTSPPGTPPTPALITPPIPAPTVPPRPAATAPPPSAPATAIPPATAITTPMPVTSPPPMVAEDIWLSILAPTPAYSMSDEVLWIASPGEWYLLTSHEGDWALAVWEFDPPEAAVWIELDGRVLVGVIP